MQSKPMLKHSKLLDSILKYLVAAILIAIPLYPKFPFIKIPGISVSIRLEDFLVAVTGVVCLILILPRLKFFLENKINQAIFIFLLTGLLSVFSAIFVTQTVLPHIAILHWLRRVEYFIPFLAGILVIKNDRKNLEFYLKVLVITLFFIFIYGFGQKHFSWPVIITQNQEYSKGVALRWIPGSHINSTFAGHYDLATFLVLILPILITSVFILRGVLTRFILWFVILSGLWLLVNAISRISLVSYLIASATSLFLVKRYKEIIIIFIISILFIGFSSDLLARYKRLIDIGRQRIGYVKITLAAEESFLKIRRESTPVPTPAPVFEDRSTSIRLNVEWPRALRAFSKNPLLGTGYSSITLATDNDYLRLLGEIGLIGFFAFFLIFFRIFKEVLIKLPIVKNFDGANLTFIAGVLGAMPGVFLNATFIDVFEASKFAIIFWLLVGMFFSLVRNVDYE